MLCNISPDDCNFGETLSSLRFAARAKEIPCHAEVNEEYSLADVQIMLRQLRSLKAENAELKHLIVKYKAMSSPMGLGGGGGLGGKSGGSGGYTPGRSSGRALSPRPGSPRSSRPQKMPDFNRKPSFNDSGGVPNIGDNRWLRNSTGFEDLLLSGSSLSPNTSVLDSPKPSSPRHGPQSSSGSSGGRRAMKRSEVGMLSSELSFVEEDVAKTITSSSGSSRTFPPPPPSSTSLLTSEDKLESLSGGAGSHSGDFEREKGKLEGMINQLEVSVCVRI